MMIMIMIMIMMMLIQSRFQGRMDDHADHADHGDQDIDDHDNLRLDEEEEEVAALSVDDLTTIKQRGYYPGNYYHYYPGNSYYHYHP